MVKLQQKQIVLYQILKEKSKMVVKKLYEKFVALESEEAKNNIAENESNSSSTALSLEIINKVKKIYECEEMSQQAPGIKDVIIRDTNDSKSKVQSRHHLLSIQEMHRIFMEENPECTIVIKSIF